MMVELKGQGESLVGPYEDKIEEHRCYPHAAEDEGEGGIDGQFCPWWWQGISNQHGKGQKGEEKEKHKQRPAPEGVDKGQKEQERHLGVFGDSQHAQLFEEGNNVLCLKRVEDLLGLFDQPFLVHGYVL